MIEPKHKDKVTIQKEQEKKTTLTLVGKIIPHAGHILFEINDSTGEIKRAKFIDGKDWHFILGKNWRSMAASVTSEVLINEGCSYVSALNEASAIRKYKEGKTGSKVFFSEVIQLFNRS